MKGWYYHYKTYNADSALQYYHEADRYFTKLKKYDKACKAVSEIGLVYHQENNLEKALNYQIQALKIADENKVNERMKGNIYYRIANIYTDHQDTPRALEYYQKSLDFYEKAKFNVGIASASIGIGNLYEAQEKHTESIKFKKIALQKYTELKDTNMIIVCLLNLSNNYTVMKQYNTALEILLKADKMLHQTTEKSNIVPEMEIKVLLSFADIYHETKDNNKAGYYLEKAHHYVVSNQTEKKLRHSVNQDIYNLIFNIAKNTQKKDLALLYAEKCLISKDSLYAENKIKTLYELEKKYKTEKKEQEIKLLTLQKRQETQKKQFYAILFAVSVLVLLSLALFLWYLRRLNRRLYEQKQELTQLNEVKNKLFSVISHDLRSPVYQMERYLHTLNPVTDKEKQYHQEIQEKLYRTQNLVDTVLHWARTQLNHKTISTGKYAVSEIVDEVFEQVSTQAQHKNILLINETDNSVFINTDKAILEIILRNLLSNAIKFSHENSAVRVYAKQNQGKTDIFVQDYGVGMNEQSLHSLLQNNQGKTTQGTAQEQGTGMGFQLVLDYIQQLGAKIQTYSKENEGTVFQISLSA